MERTPDPHGPGSLGKDHFTAPAVPLSPPQNSDVTCGVLSLCLPFVAQLISAIEPALVVMEIYVWLYAFDNARS